MVSRLEQMVRFEQLARADANWQRRHVDYLDWDRDPRPNSLFSVLMVTGWFLAIWWLLQLIGLRALTPTVACLAIAVLASTRWQRFDHEFRKYSRRRAAIACP
jgi:hypothetical protein